MAFKTKSEEFVKPKVSGGLSKSKVSEAELQIKKEEMAAAKENQNQRISELYAKYLQMQAQDNPAAFMLESVLEMLCELKNVQDQMEAMTLGIEALGSTFQVLDSTFDFMDSTFDMIDNFMERSARPNGFLRKLKMKAQMRTFVKSISARMDEFSMKLSILPEFTSAFSKSMVSFRSKMEKNRIKQQQMQSKRNKSTDAAAPGGGAKSALSPQALGVLASMGVKTEGGGAAGTGGAPTGGAPSGGAPTGGAPASGGGSSSGGSTFADDIL